MDLRQLLREARRSAGLTLRELAERAETSHSTLAAYEAGRVTPNVQTLDRVARAAGFDLAMELTPRIADLDGARGRELLDVLGLAEQFPARHSRRLEFPVFGRDR